MKKEEIRKEFLKLKNKGHSYSQCKNILNVKYNFETTTRTLKRWVKRLDAGDWDFKDKSRRPHTIHRKVTPEVEGKVLSLRDKTGWGCDKLTAQLCHLNISQITVNRILNKHNLCRDTKNKGKRKK